jgi:membrane-associated phospholipid phosphatase
MITRLARVAGRVVLLLAVLYAVMVGLGLLVTKVAEHSWPLTEEDQINRALADGRTGSMNDVTYVLSGLGDTAAIVIAMGAVAIFLRLALRRWRESVFLVLAVSAQALVFLLVTLTIDRRRPAVPHLDDSPPTSSFPSGHTGAATALFVSSALLVAWYVRRRLVKVLAVTVLVAVPLLVAFGRLYRGMHHPSDVLGAYVNGLACVTIAGSTVLGRRRGERHMDPRPAPAPASAGAA